MSQCTLLSEYRALSSDGSVPTDAAMATRGERRDEAGHTGTGVEPVPPPCGGIRAVVGAVTGTAGPRTPLSSAPAVTATPATENAGNARRAPAGTGCASAGPFYPG